MKDIADNRLSFQLAIPRPASRVAVWLFLSTEVMFFTALIAVYVIERWGLSANWPSGDAIGVSVGIGFANTMILLSSSIAAGLAIHAARTGRSSVAKSWVLATIALGSVFLGVKGYEYYVKYWHGLLPDVAGSLLYDRPDEYYLSDVGRRLKMEIRKLEQRKTDDANFAGAERLDRLYQIQSGLVGWTQYKAGRTDDPRMKQMALRALAHQIDPRHGDEQLIREYLDNERVELIDLKAQLERQTAELEKRLKHVQTSLKELRDSNQTVTNRQQADGELKRVTDVAAKITTEITTVNASLKPVNDRLNAMNQPSDTYGLNAHLRLRLPIVVAGGRSWSNVYFLLTAFHAIHVLAGLFAWIGVLPLQLGLPRAVLLENIGIYWHFVDGVWIVLFGLLYLV
jgi:cytochrome c oxidase subunit 3